MKYYYFVSYQYYHQGVIGVGDITLWLEKPVTHGADIAKIKQIIASDNQYVDKTEDGRPKIALVNYIPLRVEE